MAEPATGAGRTGQAAAAGGGGAAAGFRSPLPVLLQCGLPSAVLGRGLQAVQAAAVNCWCRGGAGGSATRLAAVPIDAASCVDHLIRVQEHAKAAAGLSSMGTALAMLGRGCLGASRKHPAHCQPRTVRCTQRRDC